MGGHGLISSSSRERSSTRTIEEFKGAIEKAFKELPVQHCQNYIAGMQKRLSLVLEKDGRAIGR